MIEDRLLVWRFNRGDAAALCRIYEKYRDDLLKVAAALLNDRSGIEDVLHDVFVTFAQNTGQLELKGSLKGYLAICVANRARDRNRTQRRRGSIDLGQARPDAPIPCGPEQRAASQETAARLDAAMADLPDEQREAVVLHVQSKMRFRDIARLRGISINTALSRYRYGLEKLRSSLNGEMEP